MPHERGQKRVPEGVPGDSLKPSALDRVLQSKLHIYKPIAGFLVVKHVRCAACGATLRESEALRHSTVAPDSRGFFRTITPIRFFFEIAVLPLKIKYLS